MARYAADILDNGDGSFVINSIMRAPTSVTISGGTELKPTRADGDAVSLNTGSFKSVATALAQCSEIAAADRAKNG